MEKKPALLHMITPAKNASPFDVNMARDAGWDSVYLYTQAEVGEVAGLVQDAIFSRGPTGVRRTGVFLGGRDIDVAMDMLAAARGAMVPPFEVSVCADPSGAFTTAAALVACAERELHRHHQISLDVCRVLVFGGSGPVGAAASVLAARTGAEVVIVSHRSDAGTRRLADAFAERYGVSLDVADGSSEAKKRALLADADVVFNTAKAGVQVLSGDQLAYATRLKVAGDVNAVPPAGIEGIGVMDAGKPLPAANSTAVGLGALAIGNVKYQVQHALLGAMLNTEKPLYLDFQQAFEQARGYVAK